MRLRLPATIAVAILSLGLLGGCGGDDDSSIADSERTSPVRDKDGFTPEQREVADAVDRYTAAVVALQKGDPRGQSGLADVATPDTVKLVIDGTRKNLQDGKVMIGNATMTPSRITISTNTAQYAGCSDFSRTAIVDRGETKAGSGDTAGTKGPVDFTLERIDGAWKMADPKGADGSCTS